MLQVKQYFADELYFYFFKIFVISFWFVFFSLVMPVNLYQYCGTVKVLTKQKIEIRKVYGFIPVHYLRILSVHPN